MSGSFNRVLPGGGNQSSTQEISYSSGRSSVYVGSAQAYSTACTTNHTSPLNNSATSASISAASFGGSCSMSWSGCCEQQGTYRSYIDAGLAAGWINSFNTSCSTPNKYIWNFSRGNQNSSGASICHTLTWLGSAGQNTATPPTFSLSGMLSTTWTRSPGRAASGAQTTYTVSYEGSSQGTFTRSVSSSGSDDSDSVGNSLASFINGRTAGGKYFEATNDTSTNTTTITGPAGAAFWSCSATSNPGTITFTNPS